MGSRSGDDVASAWMRQARDRQRAYVKAGDPARRFGDARDQARQAYAEWFESLPWHTFDTFTLALGARESGPFAWRALDRWRARMHHRHRRALRQAVALEWQDRGTAHLHALTFGYSDVSLHEIHMARELWEQASGGGYARIYPYETSGGAAGYCAKYVTKDMELRLLGPWSRYSLYDRHQLALCYGDGVAPVRSVQPGGGGSTQASEPEGEHSSPSHPRASASLRVSVTRQAGGMEPGTQDRGAMTASADPGAPGGRGGARTGATRAERRDAPPLMAMWQYLAREHGIVRNDLAVRPP